MGNATRALLRAIEASHRRFLFGFANFGAANFFATQSGGGEAGVATGFGFATLFQLTALNGASNNPLVDRSLGTNGWVHYFGSNGSLAAAIANAVPSFISAPARQFISSDIGKIFLAIGLHAGGFVRQYVDREERGSGTAISGYTAASAPHMIARSGQFSSNPSLWPILAHATFRGVPTLAQLLDYYDRTRLTGDLPDVIQGATVTHHWSARRAISTPTPIVGRTIYGARGFSLTNYLQTAGGFAGRTGSFWIVGYVRFNVLSSGTVGRFLSKCNGINTGWRLYAHSSGALYFNLFGSSPAEVNVGLTGTITASDLGQVLPVVAVYTGTVARLYFKRAQVGVDTAITYAPDTTSPFYLGRDGSSTGEVTTMFGFAAGFGDPSSAQVQALYDAWERDGRVIAIPGMTATDLVDLTQDVIASGPQNGVPSVVQNRVGPDHLSRVGALELASDTATAATPPVTVIDNVTNAAGDGMQRQGAPAGVAIDPSADGRKTCGAQGFSNYNVLTTGAGLGVRGSASGFWFAVHLTTRTIASGLARQFASCADTSLHGWYFTISTAGALAFVCGNISGFSSSSAYTLLSGDLDQPLLFVGVYTGSQIRLYVRRTQVGADVALAGYLTAVGTEPMQIGNWYSMNRPADQERWWGAAGGHAVLTLAEIQRLFDDVERTGRIQPIPGKTAHLYDPTVDVEFNGGPDNGLPVVVLDRIGTDHLIRSHVSIDQPRGFRCSNREVCLRTAMGGGIGGVQAGFWFAVLIRVAATGTNSILAARHNQGSNLGWQILQYVAGTIGMQLGWGGPVVSTTSAGIGETCLAVGVYTGTAAAVFMKGVLTTGGSTPTYAAHTGATYIGAREENTTGNDKSVILGAMGGLGVPTLAELQAAETASIAAGHIVAIPGKTDRVWRIGAAVEAAFPRLPAGCLDELASGDNLTLSGPGLALTQRVERVWSYETRPILYGANGFTNADAYAGSWSGAPAFVGSAAGFWAAVLLRIDSQAINSVKVLFGNYGTPSNTGWLIQSLNTNSTLSFVAASGSGVPITSPSFVVSAIDIGKLMLVVGVHEGAALRFYAKRALVGTSTAITGFTPAIAPINLGRDARVNFAASNLTVYGGSAGLGIPSLAEIQALHDDVMVNEDIRGIPGKTDFLVSVKRDAIANGGAIPAQLTDRVGTHHLAKQGNPTIVPHYARAFAW